MPPIALAIIATNHLALIWVGAWRPVVFGPAITWTLFFLTAGGTIVWMAFRSIRAAIQG